MNRMQGMERRQVGARAVAAEVLVAVLDQRRSLNGVLEAALGRLAKPERALTRELCYGVLRWLPQLQAVATCLLHKPLRRRDRDVYSLILIGLYQVLHLAVPDHAAVAETAEAARELDKAWAVGLVNGVLRRMQRETTTVLGHLDSDPAATYAHPLWLLDALREAWPDHWQAIAAAGNQRPPMTLRVNARRYDRAAYLARLEAAGLHAVATPWTGHGLTLERPTDVARLPEFAAGAVSVQDGAAQLAAPLLELAPGQRVLDACAAPGGKSCHILEAEPRLGELVALDRDAERMDALRANLRRERLAATTIVGDAAVPAGWWDGEHFDRLLLDAPCSATGVIRRHPDIKVLRRAGDIDGLVHRQAQLLAAVWPLLRPGGILVYATCSLLPRENEKQAAQFLAGHADARERPIDAEWGLARPVGRQILVDQHGMDGFYYARLEKVDLHAR